MKTNRMTKSSPWSMNSSRSTAKDLGPPRCGASLRAIHWLLRSCRRRLVISRLLSFPGSKAALARRQSDSICLERFSSRPMPTLVGDEAQEQAGHRRKERQSNAPGSQCHRGCPDHDDYKRRGGQRSEARTNPQKARKYEPKGAEHLADSDEPQKRTGKPSLLRHVLYRQG